MISRHSLAVVIVIMVQDPSLKAGDPLSSYSADFTLDHNRIMIPVRCMAPDGKVREATAWVDTGNDSLILARPLALDLGIDLSGLDLDPTGHSIAVDVRSPIIQLGDVTLSTENVPLRVGPGAQCRPGIPGEVCLPAAVFRGLVVGFDYPNQRITVAAPASSTPEGTMIPCQVNPTTGLFCIDVSAHRDTLRMGVDTGSAGTWLSEERLETWRARVKNWRQAKGAAGSTNFFGSSLETAGTMISLPELTIAGHTMQDVAALGLTQGVFNWYSKKSAGAVEGFIGANVLRHFRLTVDFVHGKTYWKPGPAPGDPRDLDIVGLTLCPEPDDTLTISGVVHVQGEPVIASVQPGDKLLEVNGMKTSALAMGKAIQALRGRVGETKRLVVLRQGERVVLVVPVSHLP